MNRETSVKGFLGFLIICGLGLTSYAVNNYLHKFGSLEGEIVFNLDEESSKVNPDSMKVFLISGKIGELLDAVVSDYDERYIALEDSVTMLDEQKEAATAKAYEEELSFRVAFGENVRQDRTYITAKNYLDGILKAKKDADELYKTKRDILLERQKNFNLYIGNLIDNNVVMKAEVDMDGKFKFPKVENGDYYLYALRVIAGEEDITDVPGDLYFIYALTGEAVRRYAWMTPLTVDEETTFRLDKTNMSNVFK
ncbi:MAG: hypothetical protein GY863_00710 [bacterium]|nr:hypothetical protein [bacterium]